MSIPSFAPTLRAVDLIILDNLAAHQSRPPQQTKDGRFLFLFLLAYSPDLNQAKMASAKLKALIQRAAARTHDELWRAVGHVCDLFTGEECYNPLKAAGYEAD